MYNKLLNNKWHFWRASTSRISYTLHIVFILTLCSTTLISTACSPSGVSDKTQPSAPHLTTQPQFTYQPDFAKTAREGNPLPGSEQKTLTLQLAYDEKALSDAVEQIYTPGSTTYHQYLTPQQLAQRYGSSQTTLQTVSSWLQKHGFSVQSTNALHTEIEIQGSVATIQQVFHVQLQSFTLEDRTFFMPVGTVTFPSEIKPFLRSISGLDNLALPFTPPPVNTHDQADSAQNTSCIGYSAQHRLTRDKLATAYQIDKLYKQGIQGQGMNVGIAEFDEPYDPADIATYARCVGITTPSITNVDVKGGFKLDPTTGKAGEGEAAMDIELIAGLAPKANIRVFQATTQNTTFAQALNNVFNAVATENKVSVLSVSYGTGENNFSTGDMDAVAHSLKLLAAEGVSVFISSGDCGAFSERIRNIAVVSFPASAPYAIAVGGTHLQMDDRNVRISEDTWGENDSSPVCANQWGSGGGVSQNTHFQRPSWQIGPGTTNKYNGSSSNVVLTSLTEPVNAPNGLRQLPDVSASAYPNMAIAYEGKWISAGGTSAAAPIWAAGALLLNQFLHNHKKASLGAVPELYHLANTAKKDHPYTDIIKGDNLFYPATKGWDYATGWGTPNFNELAKVEQNS